MDSILSALTKLLGLAKAAEERAAGLVILLLSTFIGGLTWLMVKYPERVTAAIYGAPQLVAAGVVAVLITAASLVINAHINRIQALMQAQIDAQRERGDDYERQLEQAKIETEKLVKRVNFLEQALLSRGVMKPTDSAFIRGSWVSSKPGDL